MTVLGIYYDIFRIFANNFDGKRFHFFVAYTKSGGNLKIKEFD